MSPDGNVSRSVIKLKINASDNGEQLSCRAENKKLLSAFIEDTLKINVFCKCVILGLIFSLKKIVIIDMYNKNFNFRHFGKYNSLWIVDKRLILVVFN